MMAQSKIFYVEFTVEILKHLNTSKAQKGQFKFFTGLYVELFLLFQ